MQGVQRAFLAVGIALALVAVTTPPASAVPTTFEDRAEFGGVNGESFVVRAVGDELWVGGEFTQAFDPDHTTTHPRTNLAVFDFNTGDVKPFVADTDFKIKAIESDDASIVWIAGNFTTVRGQPAGNIAAFDPFTGALHPTFDVTADGDINGMTLHDGWLYLAGEFRVINGVPLDRLARVDAVTGAVDPDFNPNPDNELRAVVAYGNRVYGVGLFDTVEDDGNTVGRRWVAGFNVETGDPDGPDFFLPPLGTNESIYKAGVRSVDISPDGSILYTGDQRNDATAWNRLTGQKLWNEEAEGDIQAMAADATDLYLGFHDGWDAKGDKRLLVAIDANNGARDNTWDPRMDSFIGTWSIELSQGAVAVAGDFTTINDESSPHLVVFHSPDWAGATPLTPPASETGDVNCSSTLDVNDALSILQYAVGLRTAATACPIDTLTETNITTADANGDESINVNDAITVLQCSVGQTNVLCP